MDVYQFSPMWDDRLKLIPAAVRTVNEGCNDHIHISCSQHNQREIP
jgi:hypothetical protein